MIQFTRFHHLLLSVPVGALEVARAFYGGVLGLPEAPGPHPKATIWYLVGGIELHIQEEPAPLGPRSKRHPAFEVADAAGARRRWRRRAWPSSRLLCCPTGGSAFSSATRSTTAWKCCSLHRSARRGRRAEP